MRPLQAKGCVQIAAYLGCTPCMDPKTASRCKVAHLCASRSSRSFPAVGNGGAACESTGASGRCCTARTWPSLQLMDPAQKIVRQTRHRAAAAAGVTSEGLFSSLSRIFTGTKRQCDRLPGRFGAFGGGCCSDPGCPRRPRDWLPKADAGFQHLHPTATLPRAPREQPMAWGRPPHGMDLAVRARRTTPVKVGRLA